MEDCFTNAFIHWFTSNKDCDFDEGVDFQLLDTIISSEDDTLLCPELSFEEVKAVVFDLAPDISLCPDGSPLSFSKNIGL